MASLCSLHFTETVEEFEDRIMQKKMKIPKMSLKNSGNSIENSFGEERMPLRHKKVGCQDDRPPVLLIDTILLLHNLVRMTLVEITHLMQTGL